MACRVSASKAHEQGTDADTDVIGEHIGGVGDASVRCRCGAGDEGLEEGLQDTIAQAEEEPGSQQMGAAGQKQKAEHGEDQHHQTGIDQRAMPAGVDDLLGGCLGQQHPCYQTDVEVGQISHDILFLRQNGGVGDDCPVRDHQEHHVQHERDGGTVERLFEGELFPLHLGVLQTAAGYADQGSYTSMGRPIWLLFHFLSSIGDLSPGTLVREYLPDGISMAMEKLPLVLIFCLLLWLIGVDHRYNPKERRRGWLRSLVRILRDRQLRLPVQQRLRRWALAPLAAIGVGTAAGLLILMLGISWSWWNVYFACILLSVLGFVLLLAVCVFSARHQLALARDIGCLADQTAAIRAGNLSAPTTLPADGDLRQIAEDLSQIQSGLQQALADRTRSERMKVELIANVSHDLKTPLTSILSYAELLRQEPLEGAAADYARIIDQKAQRLKVMVQDVFEVSKAASHQLPVDLERLDLAKLLRQTLADMADPIEKSGLALRTDLPEGEIPVVADGKRLYRVFQNLIQNALQYSLPGSRIYLTLTAGEGRAVASLRNTSRQELPMGVDFTARFVRGDESRTDGGSGLGLSIARSFTEACGGTLTVETMADLFTVHVSFPLAPEQ